MTVIAIDGPAGAGKSTVAKLVAQQTGLPYLDTGAMYRCVALAVLNAGGKIDDEHAVGKIAQDVTIELIDDKAILNGVDVSSDIRNPEINSVVSVIAAHSTVRQAMRSQQQKWIHSMAGGVVEGRDIGTVVFPNAECKIFLTASPEVRAQRRVDQSGGDVQQVASSIAERDRIDSTRSDSPLKPSADAHIVDSSTMTTEQVVACIVNIFKTFGEDADG